MIKKVLGITVIFLLASTLLTACGSSGTSGPSNAEKEAAYNTVLFTVQNAVTAYATNHNGELPPIVNSYTITTDKGYYHGTVGVIDLCTIVGVGQIASQVPDGCYGTSGQTNTNFFSGSCDNPSNGHYIWVMDDSGNVYSICDENQDGIYSDTDKVDGFHPNIWP